MFLVNGQVSEQLSLLDRSIHYGDGVFETIAVSNGSPLCWEQHLKRLAKGCHRLGIPAPEQPVLEREIGSLINERERAVLKIIISRGEGGRGYQSPDEMSPARIIGIYDWPDYPAANATEGIKAGVCETRLGHNPALAGIKHLNRLEQVLARSESDMDSYDEKITLDISDHVIEGTMSNLFMVANATLQTPDLDNCGIEGIIRGVILEQAPDWGLQAEVKNLTLEEVRQADELFFCNSIMGIWPVNRLLEQTFPVGKVTTMIRVRLSEHRQIVAP